MTEAEAELQEQKAALESYYEIHGRLPTEEELEDFILEMDEFYEARFEEFELEHGYPASEDELFDWLGVETVH